MAKQQLYTVSAAAALIRDYMDKGGNVYAIEPGSLGFGLWICTGEGKKTAIIKEVYINPWSSGQSIRFYNVIPKKYRDQIEKNREEIEEQTAREIYACNV